MLGWNVGKLLVGLSIWSCVSRGCSGPVIKLRVIIKDQRTANLHRLTVLCRYYNISIVWWWLDLIIQSQTTSPRRIMLRYTSNSSNTFILSSSLYPISHYYHSYSSISYSPPCDNHPLTLYCVRAGRRGTVSCLLSLVLAFDPCLLGTCEYSILCLCSQTDQVLLCILFSICFVFHATPTSDTTPGDLIAPLANRKAADPQVRQVLSAQHNNYSVNGGQAAR